MSQDSNSTGASSPSALQLFLDEARRIAETGRICSVALYGPEGLLLEFGDPMTAETTLAETALDWDALPVPDLVVEVPHGATREEDYRVLRAELSPDLPEDLIDFFFVNTDVGAPEVGAYLAEEVAKRLSSGDRPRTALVVRCLIPRTFVDTNRVIDRSGLLESELESLSSAFPEYIRTDADRSTLLSLYERYHRVASSAHALVCHRGGLAVTPHTYAPKSVGIDNLDEGIGQALRKAYEPELYATWKTRPEIDFITESGEIVDGEVQGSAPGKLAPMDLVEALMDGFDKLGIGWAENEAYTLHPASMAHHYSALHPGQALCFEVRRDLLTDPFDPFVEMKVSDSKVRRVTAPVVEGVLAHLSRAAGRD